MVMGTTLYNWLLRIFSYHKYFFLVQQKPTYQKDLVVFIDSNGTSLLPKWLGKIIKPTWEFYFWLLINRINPFHTKVITDPDMIKKDDVLIGFSVGLLDNPNSDLNTLARIKCTKIFHLTHFIQNTPLISKSAKKIGVNYFFAENNLYKNSRYFRKHFNWYKQDVYTLPFVFRDKFLHRKPFSKRKNKAAAIGTLVDVVTTESASIFDDFVSFYKTTIIQPMRNTIHLEKSKLTKYIDSYISELYESRQKTKNSNLIERLSNAVFNATRATKRKYYSFDMTETFNTYRMFVNGEEINNLPGIGFVEGMACGCAYIAQKDPMYTDIGLIPNKHFVSYDGTLQGLTKKIRKYQKAPAELQQISEAGSYFVRHHFSTVLTAQHFFEDLYQFSVSTKNNKNRGELSCSFTKNEV